MNSLSYKIALDPTPELYSNVFKVVIDGLVTDYYFDLAALEQSMQSGGVWPMFICGCGYLGCNGYYTNVVLENKTITWKDFYKGFYDYEEPEVNKADNTVVLISNFNDELKSKIIRPPLVFRKPEYEDTISKMLALMSQYPHQQKEYQIDKSSYLTGDRFHD